MSMPHDMKTIEEIPLFFMQDDHIVEVVVTEQSTEDGFLWTIISPEGFTFPKGVRANKVIYELPNGCYEADIWYPPIGPEDTINVKFDSKGNKKVVNLRRCTTPRSWAEQENVLKN